MTRRQRESKKQTNKQLIHNAKQQLCTFITLFCTFLCCFCSTTKWNCLTSRFKWRTLTSNDENFFLFLSLDMVLDSISWGKDLVKVATYSARSRQSYGKIGDCQQVYDDIETSNLLPGFLSFKNIEI